MDRVAWDRLHTAFLTALDLPPSERHNFLLHTFGADVQLLQHAQAMLTSDNQEASLLNTNIQEIVAEVFDYSSDIDASLTIGPYKLKRFLGEGGMGVVWLAQRTDAGNEIAMKFLLHASLSPLRRERFSREIRHLAKLNHPYIARMYDAGSLPDGIPWLAMEYVNGTPLTSYCRQPSRTPAEIVELFHRVCEAVQHAHQQLVIHRDLKPSNILVQSDGTPKLLDFGISRELQQADDVNEAQNTAPNMRFMSRAYAAPEWKENGVVAASNDVYSLGVLLYEMLTSDSFPKVGEERAEESLPCPSSIVAKRKKDPEYPTTPMSGLAKSSWDDLDLLCLKAVHRDPAQRYPSVEAMIRDIDHYTRAEPLEARRENLIYKTKKFLRRNRIPVLATGLATALIVSTVAFFTWRLAHERSNALIQAERAQRIQRFILSLFEGDDKEAGPGQDLRVVTLLDRGAPAAHALSAEPEVQSELYYTLGTMYMKLGRLDRADAMLQSALNLQQSNGIGDKPALADILTAQGLLRSEQGKSEQAEQLVRQAIALTDSRSVHQRSSMGREFTALGEVLINHGQYAPAIKVLQQATALESPEDSTAELSDALSNLATANLYLGNYSEASEIDHQVLQLDQGIYAVNHPRLAEDLQNISQIEDMWGKNTEAEQDERKALGIDQAWYGEENPKTAIVETSLASTLIYENNYIEAESLLRKALHTQEATYGNNSPHVAFVLNSLAGVETHKKHFQAAETYYEKMAAIYRASYGADDYRVSIASSNLAGVLLNEKRYAESQKLFEQVIQTYKKTFPADNLNIGITQIKLGRVFLAQHRYSDAEPHTLAGYEIVSKQQSPSSNFVKGARHDLSVIYQETGEAGKAGLFQAK
jgi:eukaryotic-like serine/threonine-protein kinase